MKQPEFGDYPSCGEAAMGGQVSKWFAGPQNQADCTATVTKINKGDRLDTSKDAWATEHVFEAQIVQQFWTWLASGTDAIPVCQWLRASPDTFLRNPSDELTKDPLAPY